MTIWDQWEQEIQSIRAELPRSHQGPKISVADYGARPDGSCSLKAFSQAVKACRDLGASSLSIPRGVYHFHEAPASGAHLALDGIKDLVVNGHQSELIFHQARPYVSILGSERLILRNLTLDWCWGDKPLARVGVVNAVAPDGSSFDLRFPACHEVPEDMDIRVFSPCDPRLYTFGCEGGIEFRPYPNPHLPPDMTAEGMAGLVRELSDIIEKRTEKIKPNILRFFPKDPAFAMKHFHTGLAYILRHYEYDAIAVTMENSAHITLENISIFGCPGSGFVANGECRQLHFNHCRILPRPGTSRPVSTTADCLHVVNSQGKLLIEHCDFSCAGDDCINLHDSATMGIQRLDDHSLRAFRAKETVARYAPSHQIELRNPDLSPTGYTGELTDVRYEPDTNSCVLRFKQALPPFLSPDCVLWNHHFHTNAYIIRNCRFTNNRARGALLQGSFGLVEDNVFENIQGAAIQIETGCEERWSEGHGVRALVIRNNRIRRCDLNAWQMAVLYAGVYLPAGRTDFPVFEDLRVESNTFVDCPRQAMFFSSCRRVSAVNNCIINAGRVPLDLPAYGSSQMERPIYGEKYEGLIQFVHSADCVCENNECLSVLPDGLPPTVS